MISSLRRHVALCVLLCIPAVPALADAADGPARLVADLAPGSENRYLSPAGMVSVGNKVVFLQGDNEYQVALWATDGTPEGTSVLAVPCPPCDNAVLLGSTGNLAFYRVSQTGLSPQMQIWRTDGTTAGTFPVMFGVAGPFGPFGQILGAINGGRLFFTSCTPEQGCEVWSSDGTVAGTGLVGEIVPGPGSPDILQIVATGDQAFVIAGSSLWSASRSGVKLLRETPKIRSLSADAGRAYFIADGAQGGGFEVWTSDGTTAGTRPVTHFTAKNPFGRFPSATLVAGRLYFSARHGKGNELWSVGATPQTLRRLTGLSNPSAHFSSVRKAGSRIVFVVSRQSAERKLWASNGDFRSTAMISGCAGGCPNVESDLAPLSQGRFVFKGSNPSGEALWVTDGTSQGTRLLQHTGPYHDLTQFVSLGDRVLFELTNEYETGELWLTDGSVDGTFFVSHGGPSWSHYWGWGGPLLAARANGLLVFPTLPAPGESSYGSLVSSDGSPGGMREITRFAVGKSSYPQQLVALRDRLLIQNCTGQTLEMRAVHGTETTLLLSHPFDSSCGAGVGVAYQIEAQDDRAVFLMNVSSNGVSLWGTDGTPAGTVTLIAAGPDMQAFGVARFGDRFAVWVSVPDGNGSYKSQLWTTDGTPAGTRKLLDLPGAIEMYGLAFSGGKLYFFDAELDETAVWLRPWVSDGTAAGTHTISSVNGTVPDSTFTEVAGRMFYRFMPEGGTTEIWSTDGTPAGTGPAITAAAGMHDPQFLAGAGGRLYFAARRAPGGRLLPWVSDGTDAGTAPLADVAFDEPPGYYVFPAPRLFTQLGDRVYFAASDKAHGNELWSTDGTPEGTALMKDIAPGKLDSLPRNLVVWHDRLYFRARDIAHGMELWTSDGTAEGTRLVQDISAGPSWSDPQELTVAAGSLYLSAHDGEHGRELWELPEEP